MIDIIIYDAGVRIPLSAARFVAAAAAVGVVMTVSAEAHAVRLVVRASPTIEARAYVDGDAYVLRGALRDDVGSPIASAHVEVSILRGAGPGERVPLPPAQPCTARPAGSGNAGRAIQLANDAYVLDTDGAGVFCVRAPKLPERGVLQVRFTGLGALDPVTVETAYDVARAAPVWGWDPRPDDIDLDVPRALATVSIADASRGTEGVAVTLWDERGAVLATGRTDGDGRAILAFATTLLSPPGAGSWEVRAGNARSGEPALRAAVTRIARVALVTAPPAEPIVPSDGHLFEVVAETSRGPADGGAVEAVIGDRVVGTGPVRAGQARVPVAFELKGAGNLPLTFRYLSASPFLKAGPPVTIPLAVRPPSPLRRAPLLLLGLGVLAWIARSWRRAPAVARPAREASAEPVAEVVAHALKNAEGWQGTVVDAHGRSPIQGASVGLWVRDFHGERCAAAATTDAQGSFALRATPPSVALLVIEAPFHSRLERPLPPPGKLTIALVARRRSLLNRLVDAARRAGGGWVGEGDPTPGHVARVGLDAGKRDPAAWALAVESAAFGTAAVDAATEERIAALETDLPPVPARDVRR